MGMLIRKFYRFQKNEKKEQTIEIFPIQRICIVRLIYNERKGACLSGERTSILRNGE
jgi:hypothetical protein